ncbi:sensor histidine kinase [Enterocloster citroniae]|uniref:sensor histidine kinase n=1 Tax=Enterocloster citroniae TaxID=358743 RepID=UPI00349F0127
MLKRSLRNSFLRIASLICLPILCVGTLVFYFSFTTLVKETQNRINASCHLMEQSLTNVFREVNKQKSLFEGNSILYLTILQLLNNETLTYEQVQTLRTITPIFNSTLGYDNIYHSLYVYMPNRFDNFFSSNNRRENLKTTRDPEWYQTFLNMPEDENILIQRRTIRESSLLTYDVISIYQRFHKNNVIVINIRSSYFENILTDVAELENMQFFLLDLKNQPLVSSLNTEDSHGIDFTSIMEQDSDTITIRHQDYFVEAVNDNPYMNYVFLIPRRSLYALSNKILATTFLTGGLGLLISISIAWYTNDQRRNQIFSILSVFEAAEKQQQLPEMVPVITDEYSLILNNIIKTFLRNNELNMKLTNLQYQKASAELVALQCQLNPHFLFNTLQTINFELMQLPGSAGAVRMLANLSHLLRYTLDSPEKLPSLQDEILATKEYIALQKVRYGDTFDVLWDYEEDALQELVKRLLIQPIIENSLLYGMKGKQGKMIIKIKILKQNHALNYTIIDNGTGMVPARLREIAECLKQENYVPHNHIGLANTNQRIKLQYPGSPGIHLYSKENMGTIVSWSCPLAEP